MKTLAAVLTVFLAVSATAQEYIEDPESGMRSAMLEYQNGRYDEAYRKFKSLAERYSLDGHYSSYRFMAAKSLYKAGEYAAAISLFDDYLDDFPRSRYSGSAMLFKGHSFYKLGNLMDAASAYMASADINPKGHTASIARENLDPLVDQGLSIWQLKKLIDEHPVSGIREEIEIKYAERLINSGRFRSGASALRSFLKRDPYGPHSGRARELLELCGDKLSGSQLIGILAPLTGNYSEYGRSMVEGAKLAVKYMLPDSMEVSLIIKDNGGDPVRATNLAARLANDECLALVGPLRSESAVGAAVIANQNGIPMITPTASQRGIASIGSYIFQVSPAVEMIGQAIAEYAVNGLGIKEFAVISPDDIGGSTVSKSFSQTVYRLGGEVIYTGYYELGATDFKMQIKPLREFLLMKTEEQLAAGEIDSSEYLEYKKFPAANSPGAYFDSLVMIDTDEWPVRLGGLFLPGYPDELKLLIPQTRYHIIRTRFLGADGWDSEELIKEVKRYIGDAVFATDFHAGSDEVRWVEFENAYSAEYGRKPDKVAALTFDAVALVLAGLKEGYNEPDRLRDYLGGIKDYQGVSCNITFKGNGRANDEVRIYTVDGKNVAKADY
jgi:ABC-type branched-subunit amino acid transport system substrate-binding protein/outer membrane protein assembly factor BamD (BamD/ComL family)